MKSLVSFGLILTGDEPLNLDVQNKQLRHLKYTYKFLLNIVYQSMAISMLTLQYSLPTPPASQLLSLYIR